MVQVVVFAVFILQIVKTQDSYIAPLRSMRSDLRRLSFTIDL